MPQKTAPQKVLDAGRNAPGTRVKAAVSDIDGILRGKYLHKDKFFSAADGGFGFCDVVFGWDMNDQCYDNTTLTGWHQGVSHSICPRQVLKRVLKRAEKLGVNPMCGMEFEWFNFAETPQSWAAKHYVRPEPITPGMFGYSLLRAGQNREFF